MQSLRAVCGAVLVLVFSLPCNSQGVLVDHQTASNRAPNAARSRFLSLQAMAREGSVDAMLDVANCFFNGLGVSRDEHMAYQAFLKAAETGSETGMFHTATCLLNGRGVAKDYSAGMKWLIKSADCNYPDAIRNLTLEFLTRYERTNRNASEVRKWSERGALLGIAVCQRTLAMCFEAGTGGNCELGQAFHWYSKAASAGDGVATVRLALCHRDGIGTDVNESKALLLLQEAAASPNLYAIHQFAISLDELVVAKRFDSPEFDPLGLSRRAGRNHLTVEYEREVVRQLQRATALGCVESMSVLAEKYAKGQGCEANPEEAFELAQKCEHSGNAQGIYLLAECYVGGIGVKPNRHKAVSLYAKAAKLGSPDAQYRFAMCLASGNGIRANMVACKRWMITSSTNGCEEATVFLQQLAQREEAARQAYVQSIRQVQSFIHEAMSYGLRNSIEGLNRRDNENHERWMHANGYY